MYRGGGWNNEAYYCRAADRRQRSPADRHCNIGFRVAVVLAR
jgi:formylglycine-generating enzyme required for sulfatase activity